MDAEAAIERLAELWLAERLATRARFALERRALQLIDRVARGVALRDLHIDETDAAAGGRTLLWLTSRRGREAESLRLGNGDPVRLWWDDPDGPDAVRAVVAGRRDGRIGVVVDGDVPERLDDGGFHLDRDDPESTFERGAAALRRLATAPAGSDLARLRGVFFGGVPPAAAAPGPWSPLDTALNPPQLEAVAQALAAPDVALIHGPPGTGKTRTLAEVIRQAAARGERVLATAASNTAVDNLAEKLAERGVPLVRLGHPARVAGAVLPRTLDELLRRDETYALARRWLAEADQLVRRARARRERGGLDRAAYREATSEAARLRRDARRQLAGVQRAILARAPVVCATAAGADAALLGDVVFDLVVVDEATQAPDPVALVALVRGRRAVLAGDPRQLPPTVVDPAAAAAGLATTLFERLAAACPGVVRMLEIQHRMHEVLMAFPSRSMYDGRLVAAPLVAGHTLEGLGVAPDPLRPGPLVFIDTAGTGWDEGRAGDDPSTHNDGHAARVAAEVRRLLDRGVPATDLAVITPYEAQARRLRESLAPEARAGLEIGTVDGFQGREKEAIVVDLVRSNDAGELGFLADTRRMNVALTRARRFLLVLGDSATLGAHPYYASFLAAADAAGAWRSAWSDECPPW